MRLVAKLSASIMKIQTMLLLIKLYQNNYLVWIPFYFSHYSAVTSGTSSLLSICLFILLFAIMQVYKTHIASTQLMTVVGGYLGSVLFILALTVSLYKISHQVITRVMFWIISLTVSLRPSETWKQVWLAKTPKQNYFQKLF